MIFKEKQGFSALHLVLFFWAVLQAPESPAHSQSVVFHHFYTSQDTGSPVYLSAELPNADGLGLDLEQIPSLQSRLEQLAPSERLLVVKQAESHDQRASLQPVGLELHPRNSLPDQASCVLSRFFPGLLPSNDIEFYGNPIEIHTLQGDINPQCSQVKTADGGVIPFGSTSEHEFYPDGLWLMVISPLKHTDQESDTDSFGIPGVSGTTTTDLRELLSGSYGGGLGPKFDFKPGGGGLSNLMDINVMVSLLPTAREKRVGDRPVLVLGNQEGVSIEVIDTQGHQWQQFYTMDEARDLLEGVEDGDELLSRLRGNNLSVKVEVIEDLSKMCRENMKRIGQFLQSVSVTHEQSIPGIISCPTEKEKNQKENAFTPDDRKSSASHGETSKSASYVGVNSNDDDQDNSDKPPPGKKTDSDTTEPIEDAQFLINRLVEASERGDVQVVREVIEKHGNHLLFGLHLHNGDSALHAAIRHKQETVSSEIESLCDESMFEQLWNLPNRDGKTPSELKLIVNRKILSDNLRSCWPICEYCKKIAIIPYQQSCGCIACKTCVNKIEIEKICKTCDEEISSCFIDKAQLKKVIRSIQPLQTLFRSERQCSCCKKIAIPPFQASCSDFYCLLCCISFDDRTSLTCFNQLCGKSIEWLVLDKAQWRDMFQGDFPASELANCKFVVNKPNSIESKTHRKNWEAVLDAYNDRGILVRIFTDRTGVTVENRVEQLISGNPASATFLLAGAAIDLLNDEPGAGLMFSPNFQMIGMFKKNAYTLNPFNAIARQKGYDNLRSPISKTTFKNHLNFYSLVMKTREQALWNDWARTNPLPDVSRPTSGHIDINGDFTNGKMKQWSNSKEKEWENPVAISMNEIVVGWENASDRILGVLVLAPVTFPKIHVVKRIISKLNELQSDHSRFLLLPVVLYECDSCRMTLLGSIESLVRVSDKVEQKILYSLLIGASLNHDLLESIYHDWKIFSEEEQNLHDQAMRSLQYSGLETSIPVADADKLFFSKNFVSLPVEMQSLASAFNNFRIIKSRSSLIYELLNPAFFSDNLQRLVEFVPILAPDLNFNHKNCFITIVFVLHVVNL